jgi:tRNA(Ile)-lysidine synthase
MSIDPKHIVTRFLREHDLKDRPVLVGFSGGADSCALLIALQQLGQPLTAVHFQHGLRGKTAVREEAWCRKFCEQRKIPFQSRSLQVPQQKHPRETIEEAARRLRLEAWEELSDDGQIPVFLAHHADDCLEDLFLRLARGANSTGLTGLRNTRRIGKVLLCRPFLNVRKSVLEDFLRAQGYDDWCLDDSNQDNRFRRNAVRNRLLPEFRRIFSTDAGLLQARENLLEDAKYLEEMAEKQLPQLTSRAAWQAVPPALLPRVLRLWLLQEYSEDTPPSATLCRRLQKALQKDGSSGEIIPAGGRRQLFLDKNGLRRFEPQQKPPPLRQWDWRKNPCLTMPESNAFFMVCPDDRSAPEIPGQVLAEESFSYAELPAVLQVRFWQPGDAMVPFGGKFHKKLQDLFTDAHISRDQRSRLPLLLAGSSIIWVPTVRRAEFARTVKGEKKITLQYGFFCRRFQ